MIENKNTEFKSEYTNDIRNAIIAFANTDGGTIYVGIADNGEACGVADLDNTLLRITNMARDSIRPDITMFIEYEVVVIDDKNVIAVTVQRGTSRPYYRSDKGIRSEGVYVRQGASSVPASEAAIKTMIKETSGDSYEAALSIIQELDFEYAESVFGRKNIEFGMAQYRTLKLTNADNRFTNLALLLSDQCPHIIKAARFDGTKTTNFHNRCEFDGSVFKQLDEAYEYLDKYNQTRSEFSGLYRIDMRDYPPEAIREALMNAVVHRDYSQKNPTSINIYDNRIEIINNGGLANGLSYNDMMLGMSTARNENLSNIFYRLEFIEAYGTGILKIREAYQDYHVQPFIQVGDNVFKIILPNTNYKRGASDVLTINEAVPEYIIGLQDGKIAVREVRESKPDAKEITFADPFKGIKEVDFANAFKNIKSGYIDDFNGIRGGRINNVGAIKDEPYGETIRRQREEKIVALLQEHHKATRKDIEEALGVSQATAILVIRELLEKGVIEKCGNGRYSEYTLGDYKDGSEMKW